MNNSTHATSSRRWFLVLLLLLVLAFNFAIRWRLRDMPLERDEGEYAYAGQLILQGILPYKLAFNMKFPGTYFMYALLMAIFGQTSAGIHIGILLVTSLTALLLYFIGRELLSETGALIATVIYVCLAALPKAAGLAGHATHFVSFFVCAGIAAILMARKKGPILWWFLSGTAFGMAILMKQHAIFFPLFILVWRLWKQLRKETSQKNALIVLPFCAGCVIPILVTAIGFACAGLWKPFIFWTFQYARQYVSMLPLGAAPGQFAAGFDPVFESGIWSWLFGIAGLVCLWRRQGIFPKRSHIEPSNPVTTDRLVNDGPHPTAIPSPLPSDRRGEGQGEVRVPAVAGNPQSAIRNPQSPELAALMFLAGMAAACPGFYFRNHYFLMAMPALALLNAAFILTVAKALNDRLNAPQSRSSRDEGKSAIRNPGGPGANRSAIVALCLIAFILGDLLVNNAAMWFELTPLQLSRQLYGNNPFPESIPIAKYLEDHSAPTDTIAVLGSEPEIFFLSHRHSASGFIYLYSLTEPQPLAPQMQKEFMSEIETNRPKFVISVNNAVSWYSLILPVSFRYASAIQNWWANYSSNYDLVGTVKIPTDKPSQFSWNETSLNPADTTNADLLIYRRKPIQ